MPTSRAKHSSAKEQLEGDASKSQDVQKRDVLTSARGRLKVTIRTEMLDESSGQKPRMVTARQVLGSRGLGR